MKLAGIVCFLLMLAQVGFGIAEMFAWDHEMLGPKILAEKPLAGKTVAEMVEWSAFLARNQGAYNVFLGAGFGLALIKGLERAPEIAWFFAACVALAGIVGAWTGITATLYVQTAPAAVLMLLLALKR